MVVWRPDLFPVRPELVLKAGIPAWGASGAGGATTMMTEPVRIGPQIGATGAAPGQVSLAFLAGSAMSADLPTTRERARVSDCRDLTAADMVAEQPHREDRRRPRGRDGHTRWRAGRVRPGHRGRLRAAVSPVMSPR